MAAIDYATTVSSLNTAIGTATGANLALLTDVRDRLAKLGSRLTSRFTSEVDTSKTAWEPDAEAAFDEAQEAADFVFDAELDPADIPAGITWNPYSLAEILGRVAYAATLTPSAFVQRALTQHRSTLSTAFSVGPDDARHYTSRPRRIIAGAWKETDISVAELEREIYATIQEATEALALEAFS